MEPLSPKLTMTMTECELKRVLQAHFRRFVTGVCFVPNEKGEVCAVVEFERNPKSGQASAHY
jgi:hypothetical protein